MADKLFFVLGGEYADTTFTRMQPGQVEERFGPFTEKEAYDHWRAITGKTVDNALVRYRVRPADAPNSSGWYVVGGEYSDTDFKTLMAGQKLENFGPFARPEAMAVWRAMSTKSVDNALVRYQIIGADRIDDFVAAHETGIAPQASEITAWRQRLGLSAQDAAAALEVTTQTLAQWEHGEQPVPGPVRVACRLIEAARGK